MPDPRFLPADAAEAVLIGWPSDPEAAPVPPLAGWADGDAAAFEAALLAERGARAPRIFVSFEVECASDDACAAILSGKGAEAVEAAVAGLTPAQREKALAVAEWFRAERAARLAAGV